MGKSRHDRDMELAGLMAQATLFATYNPQQDWRQGERILEEALALAHEGENESAEARILWNLLYLYATTGRMVQAIAFGERSLALARKLNLREQIAYTLADLVNHVYFQRTEFEKARSVLTESMAIWLELDNQPMLADTLSALSLVHLYTNEYEQAIARSDEAFRRSQLIGTLWGQCYSRLKIGYVYWQLGQIDMALAKMAEGLRLGELSGFTAPQVVTRVDLARLYAELGLVDRGLQHAELALVAAESLNLPFHAAALGTLAHFYALLGDNLQAEAALERGKNTPSRISHPVWCAPVPLAEALLALRLGDFARLQEATATLLPMSERGIAFEAILLQCHGLLAMGQREEATALLLAAHQEAQALGMKWALWRIGDRLSQLDSDSAKRRAFRQQAQETLLTIIESIPVELRASFLALSEVEALLR